MNEQGIHIHLKAHEGLLTYFFEAHKFRILCMYYIHEFIRYHNELEFLAQHIVVSTKKVIKSVGNFLSMNTDFLKEF